MLGGAPGYAVIVWRPRTRVDETLDVLAAHGIAGFTGILFIGFFAQQSWNGISDGLFYGNAGQLGDQALAALAAPVYAFGDDLRPAQGHRRGDAAARDRARGGARHGRRSTTARRPTSSGEGAILVTPEAGEEVPVPVAQP